ncbi:hypothetical protein D187_009079 [Cystobacter fuscus DSM 2262]|uniref:Uncharacterized protein n=1 Tax=Cystobacter fuscus (strain ATCC 25194 / DSM 2262 / NBRC 100088 / M29) TaxID=1242864 RepID=S9QGG0_CYSF2|nr:hypothetical protein D187_009079 [Cystobacter fuscus DSM 2262]
MPVGRAARRGARAREQQRRARGTQDPPGGVVMASGTGLGRTKAGMGHFDQGDAGPSLRVKRN